MGTVFPWQPRGRPRENPGECGSGSSLTSQERRNPTFRAGPQVVHGLVFKTDILKEATPGPDKAPFPPAHTVPQTSVPWAEGPS